MIKILTEWQRRNWFREMVHQGDLKKPKNSHRIPRLYVVVRDDLLPPIHQGIQAAHACVALADKTKVDPKSYLILLGVKGQNALPRDTMSLALIAAQTAGKEFAVYFDNGLIDPESGKPLRTAIAFEPMPLIEGTDLFGHLVRAE